MTDILTPSERAVLTDHAEYADQFRLTFEALLPGPVAKAIIEIVHAAPRMLATITALTDERDDLKSCGVVTGVFYDRSTGIDDVSICENERPCAEHPPEAWLTEQNRADEAEEALAESRTTIVAHEATIAELKRRLVIATEDANHHRHCVTCAEDGCDPCYPCRTIGRALDAEVNRVGEFELPSFDEITEVGP